MGKRKEKGGHINPGKEARSNKSQAKRILRSLRKREAEKTITINVGDMNNTQILVTPERFKKEGREYIIKKVMDWGKNNVITRTNLDKKTSGWDKDR